MRMVWMDSAALTGTVDFSTTILEKVASSAIFRAQDSTYFRSAARPAPFPYVLVGVLTEMKIRSASYKERRGINDKCLAETPKT